MTETDMSAALAEFVREEKDRHEIRQCLLRYTRGVDRHDRALMLSAYHPDAIDEHGVAEGNPEQFCDWAIGWHARIPAPAPAHHQQHHPSTSMAMWPTLKPTTPSLATIAKARPPSPLAATSTGSRSASGEWRIARRVCVNQFAGAFEMVEMPPEAATMMRSTGPNTRDRNDISYDRPLTGNRGAS
jgi:hypothetical protein